MKLGSDSDFEPSRSLPRVHPLTPPAAATQNIMMKCTLFIAVVLSSFTTAGAAAAKASLRASRTLEEDCNSQRL
jgi:hypothetical protein